MSRSRFVSSFLSLLVLLVASRGWGLLAPTNFFGDGSDGALTWTPTSDCSTGCPSLCTCSGVYPACVCKLPANSALGSEDWNAQLSTFLQLTSLTINQAVTLKTAAVPPSQASASLGGSTMWLKVRGDADLGTAGAHTAISMAGFGQAGGGTCTPNAAQAGATGCRDYFQQGDGGTQAGPGAGGPATNAALKWFLGMPGYLPLYGAGGPGPTCSTKVSCSQLTFDPTFGGPSGGSGGCSTASPTGCGSTTPGYGGGGLILDVGGDLKTFNVTLDTSGTACVGQTAGGSGGGSQLLRYRTCDGAAACSGTFKVDAGAACAACTTGCAAGGAGGNGVAVQVQIPYP